MKVRGDVLTNWFQVTLETKVYNTFEITSNPLVSASLISPVLDGNFIFMSFGGLFAI